MKGTRPVLFFQNEVGDQKTAQNEEKIHAEGTFVENTQQAKKYFIAAEIGVKRVQIPEIMKQQHR